MKLRNLEKETPREGEPLLVTDGEEYCCAKYLNIEQTRYGLDRWFVLGCDTGFALSDIEISFEPTHFAYISEL